MHILQVVADGAPGGGTTCVLQLTEDLLRSAHEVTFVSQVDSYAIEAARELGAAVINRIDFFRSRLDRLPAKQLVEIATQVAPEIVHLHGGRAAFFYTRGIKEKQTVSQGKKGCQPVSLYTVHGYHFTRKSWWLRWLAQMAERRISRRVELTVFVSEYDRQLAQRCRLLPASAAHRVIYNGVSSAELPNRENRGDGRRVAAVGRLTFQKDPHRVLDIAAKLQEEGFFFDLIGGGELEGEVRERVAKQGLKNVTVHGAVSRQKTLELLSSAGAFLLASRWEGLPIAPLEAMICGVPVVLSDVGGNPEVVEHNVSGLIVPQTDTDGYVSALRRIANDLPFADRLVAAARTRVRERFSRDAMLSNYLKAYHELRNSTIATSL